VQYFEDVEIGRKMSFGSYAVTREEVVEFATKYDPQPFHMDDEAAAKTHFGRLSASGWHTGAMVMAMLVANMKANPSAGLGSPGIDELRWLRPVYPGDTLRVETEVIAKRQSTTKPEMGFFKSTVSVYNQDDVKVMTMISNGIIATRTESSVKP
jgi:acyl dehydratase